MSEANLAGKAVRGTRTSLLGLAAKVGLQIVGLLVLSRLLSPADFGLVAVPVAAVGVGEVIRDLGLSVAAIQAKELSASQRSNLFWANLVVGVLLCALYIAASRPIAAAFGSPEAAVITAVLSSTFVLNGFAAQFRASLNRDMRFTALVVADVVAATLAIFVAVVLAANGAGFWAVVTQYVCSAGVGAVILAAAAQWWPGMPSSLAESAHLVRFGASVSAAQVVAYLGNNADTFVLGFTTTPQRLGLYSRSFQLVVAPLGQFKTPLTTVALPVLSRLRGDGQRYARYLRVGQAALGYGVIPIAAVAICAPAALADFALGPQWSAAVPVIQVLGAAGALQQVSYVAYWIFVSHGLGNSLLRYSVVAAVVRTAAILALSPLGPVGVAWGYVTGSALMWPVALVWSCRMAGVPLRPVLTGAGRIVLCTGTGVAAAWAAVSALDAPAILEVLAVPCCFALVYVLAAIVVRPVRMDLLGLWDLARRFVRRGG
ncbi:lipopolysaccharide biosynthesis protein [Cellulomonas shaoxiangyii]|uniref:lipopolysaccharide biosynthesis protein n=1 Tax=Cellulomonas shaoxiangyii TaxID=2566013 RepID=UPI00140A879D|nr:lipopolysaccharide biosynthesis protein [Cellulomonas shaoxiangyii]